MICERMQAVAYVHILERHMIRCFYVYRCKIPQTPDSCEAQLVCNFLSGVFCSTYDTYIYIVFLNKFNDIISKIPHTMKPVL